MTNYYLDIETTGLNCKTEKIISIQYQRLNETTGESIGEFKILKEWETSEKEILSRFFSEFNLPNKNVFSFISLGYNLFFEHTFLKAKSTKYGFGKFDLLSRPHIDLHNCGILMNKGQFKGSGLDKLTNKPRDGKIIPEWYSSKQYDKIIDYINSEKISFVDFTKWLYKKMPSLLVDYKNK